MISMMNDVAHHLATSSSHLSSPSLSHTTVHRVRGTTSSEVEAVAQRKLEASSAVIRYHHLLPCAIHRVDMTSSSAAEIRFVGVKIEADTAGRALRVIRSDTMASAQLLILPVKKKKNCAIVVRLVLANSAWADEESTMRLLPMADDQPDMEEANIEVKVQVIEVVAQDPRKLNSALKRVTVANILAMIVALLHRLLGQRDTVAVNLAEIMENKIAVILVDLVAELGMNHPLLRRIW